MTEEFQVYRATMRDDKEYIFKACDLKEARALIAAHCKLRGFDHNLFCMIMYDRQTISKNMINGAEVVVFYFS